MKHHLLCLLLVLSTLAVYLRVVRFTFADFDDGPYILENDHVKAGLNWATVRWAVSTGYDANWHPLTWISHAADCEIFGLDPAGPHAVNLLWHVLNLILVFCVLAAATGMPGRSLMVAALFAMHPLNVESVAWISERKNLLSMFFLLLTLAAYGRYAKRPNTSRYLPVPALFALGLAAKPMVIALPLLLLLADFWPLRRIQGWSEPTPAVIPQMPPQRLLWEKLPLLALSAASAAITLIAQSSAGAVQPFQVLPLSLRLQNALYSFAKYLWSAFWPTNLAVFYPLSSSQLSAANLALAALLLAAITFWAWRGRFRHPYLITGWLWFLVSLLPVIGIVQVGGQARADRYMYLPLLGIFVIVVWAAADFLDRTTIPPVWRASLAAVVLVALSLVTWRQLDSWRDPYALWTHTLAVTQDNSKAEHNFAVLLLSDGRTGEALPHLENAVRLDPTDAVALVDIGADHADHGRIPQAINYYTQAIQATADPATLVIAFEDLGGLYHRLGDKAQSRASYERVLQINPGDVKAKLSLGTLYLEEVNPNLAEVLAVLPTSPGYVEMGDVLRKAGKRREARAAYEKALSLDSTNPEAAKALQIQQAVTPSLP